MNASVLLTKMVSSDKPLYILCFKLSNILVIGIVTKDNCLFRSMPRRTMLVVQQSMLIVLWSILFAIHLYVVPFNDRISNRSELVSPICNGTILSFPDKALPLVRYPELDTYLLRWSVCLSLCKCRAARCTDLQFYTSFKP